MKTIEDIVYSAISHGAKDELYREVGKIRNSKGSPTELLEIYQIAYDNVVSRM